MVLRLQLFLEWEVSAISAFPNTQASLPWSPPLPPEPEQAPLEHFLAPSQEDHFPQMPRGLMPFSLRAVFPSLLFLYYSTAPHGSLSVPGTL